LAPEDGRAGPSSLNNRVSTPPSPNRLASIGQAGAARPEARQVGQALSSRTSGKVRPYEKSVKLLMTNYMSFLQYYSPSFLNIEQHDQEQRKPKRYPEIGPSVAAARQIDPLYKLGLHPGHPSLHDDSYKNPLLLVQYVSQMGKIEGRKRTELTRRSQREVGKAIRRLRSMGLIPVMSKNYTWRR
jgi:ribosomal protein S18